MKEDARYRTLAAECRQLAWVTSTRQTIEALLQMADEYERKAEAIKKRSLPLPS